MRKLLAAFAQAILPKPHDPLPIMQAPLSYERVYYGKLRNGPLKDAKELVDIKLDEYLHARTDAFDGPDSDFNDELFDVLREHRIQWDDAAYAALVVGILAGISAYQAAQLNDVLSAAFGPSLPTLAGNETWLARELADAVQQNVELIRSLPESYYEQLSEKVGDVLVTGGGPKALTRELQKSFEITDNRALLIAIDQTNKFYGKLNQLRQEQLGITHYIWRTQRDNRVRDGHVGREGLMFSWNVIPIDVGGGAGHPGQPIRCRCWAEPVLDMLKR